jgi:hypothetical protein
MDHHLPPYNETNVLNTIKQKLQKIRTGQEEDVFGWNYIVGA